MMTMTDTTPPVNANANANKPAPSDIIPMDEVMPTRRPAVIAILPEDAALAPDHATQWPRVLAIVGTPATGCDLLEWPGCHCARGRYIVRRYADHRLTDRYTTDSLKDAEALFWHLTTPLPELSDDANGAFGFSSPGE
jgi:hypothetical protein